MNREGLPAATRFRVIALSLLYALAVIAAPLLTDLGEEDVSAITIDL